MKRVIGFFTARRKILLICGIMLILSGIAHAFNMFKFPYYENDEGVYLSQAWSLVKTGALAPYTYWYDHAPAGWIFLAFWTLLTGGFYTFGFSLNTGRVFILILHIISTLCVFIIARKLTKNTLSAVIATFLFSLSPLHLYFGRRILLDNIMIFWVLVSYVILLSRKLTLFHIVMSAICFGIAVLTKENAIFFIPGFLLTMYATTHPSHRFFVIIKWIVIMGCVVSLYFVYAQLKGELFPTGTLLGGDTPHVSLLGTLKFQASRDGGSITDMEGSSFWRNMRLWMGQDPLLVIAGATTNILVLCIGIFQKQKRAYIGLAMCGIFFWYFLLRGGIVIEFYIVPLLPFFALYMGIFIAHVWHYSYPFLPAITSKGIIAIALLGAGTWYGWFAQEARSFTQNNDGLLIWQSDQTTPQLEAIEWIRENVHPSNVIVIDNYGYIDLQDPENPSGIFFPDAEWYWKVDNDSQVYDLLLKKNPENIDLIAKTPQMNGDLQMGNSPSTTKATDNARILRSFSQDGWGVEIWAPRLSRHVLDRSWQSYKQHFILPTGRTRDPYIKNSTSSEGQSYSLLRAVWMNDKETFDTVWAWTKSTLQLQNGLFSWKWETTDGFTGKVVDEGTATDADQDIALALAFASKLWKQESYLTESRKILQGIWNNEVKIVDGKPYLVAGNWAVRKPTIITNPSYLSPYAYRVFEKVLPEHDWDGLIYTSYDVLEKCTESNLDKKKSVYLPPEWCEITSTGVVQMPKEEGLGDSQYGYNAVRVGFRIALDYLWNREPRAKAYLEKMQFLRDEYRTKGKLVVGYSHDGQIIETNESLLAYATALGNFQVTDKELADKMYKEKIFSKFYEDEENSYWDDPNNYYTNNWAWFATALYADRLINVYEYPDFVSASKEK